MGDDGKLLAGDDLREANEATFSSIEVAFPGVGALHCCLGGFEVLRSMDGGETAEGVMVERLSDVDMLGMFRIIN